jgi:hypothetical protein
MPYTPPGTGAVPTTVAAKLAQTVSVFDFGADPTGATDSTAAIMAAVTYLNSLGGGKLYYPSGSYLVGSSTFVSYVFGSIQHEGASTESTVIINASTNQPAINVGNGVTQIYGGGIKNMRFTTKAGVVAVSGQTGFTFSKVGQFRIENVLVANTLAACYRGAYFTACSQYTVYNLQTQGCVLDGHSHISATDPYVTDCRSDANGGAGYVLNFCQGGEFKSCTAFINNVAWGLSSTTPASSPNKNNYFFACVGDTSVNYNWQIQDSQDSVWVGCWGSTQQSITVNTSAVGFFVTTQYCTRLTFAACIAVNNNGQGLQLFDAGASAPTAIIIDSCQLTGNGVAAGGGWGLALNGVVNKVRVNGGNLSGNATAPILNQSSQTDITISGSPIGYAPANNPLMAGPSPWTSTAQITDSLVVLTTVAGITALTVGGVTMPITANSSFFLKAGHQFIATWATTAPVFTFIPQA